MARWIGSSTPAGGRLSVFSIFFLQRQSLYREVTNSSIRRPCSGSSGISQLSSRQSRAPRALGLSLQSNRGGGEDREESGSAKVLLQEADCPAPGVLGLMSS